MISANAGPVIPAIADENVVLILIQTLDEHEFLSELGNYPDN